MTSFCRSCWPIRTPKPRTHSSYGYGRERAKLIDTWWVHWLLDSCYDAGKGTVWFQQQMDEWLVTLTAKQAVLNEEHDILRLLTADLTAVGQIERDPFPRFFQFTICPQQLATRDNSS